MYVVKRSGKREPVSFDKVLRRIQQVATGLNVNATRLAQLVLAELSDGVQTTKLDEIAADIAITYITHHPDWGTLASKIVISNCQRSAPKRFSEAMAMLAPILAADVTAFIAAHAAELDAMIVPENDFLLDFFGYKTLEKKYLNRVGTLLVETPQYMWMRVAVGLWGSGGSGGSGAIGAVGTNIERIQMTYALMSTKAFTHATPTLFNAGLKTPQLASCYLLGAEDSIDGIYDALKQCATISKHSGGIGIHFSEIRAQGSHIAGTNGQSGGIVPFLRTFNNSARAVDQGGRRNGSIAVYLEPWHADLMDFLKLKSPKGAEETRANDLFYALWIPDLFMRRVKEDASWSLFCPHECPGLSDAVGPDFDALVVRYETEGRARKTLSARKIWIEILTSQTETGMPYLLYKDAANLKSNQKNLGTIRSSNLCTEIIEYSSTEETAVCNLASLSLPYFIDRTTLRFNFTRLREITSFIVGNLNRIIDINFYPTPQTRRSNMRHRPIGIGIQGLADVFAQLGYAWESPEASALNKEIFENIYYAAVNASRELALRDGPYETFAGSPASKGILQPDMWADSPTPISAAYLDWSELRAAVKRDGIRNSLLVAPMPTASTSQILGNNECFEPFTSNIYARRTNAGEFVVINRYMVDELSAKGLWTPEIKDRIMAANGSVQDLHELPPDLRARFKTVWEISQKTLIDMSADRGRYVCQSQSLNLYANEPTFQKLSSMQMYAWSVGLKTGVYYLHTKSAVQAIKFSIDPATAAAAKRAEDERKECLMCSS